MSLSKPDKAKWEATAPNTDEPADSKKTTGWLPAERPPAEWFNWIFNQGYDWEQWSDLFLSVTQSLMLRSDAVLAWNANSLAFASDIEFIFKTETISYINSIAAADSPIALADGEVVVAILTDSDVALTSAAYGVIAAGNYSVVAEASLTQNNDENEVILFRARGTYLEIPLIGVVVEDGDSFIPGSVPDHEHLAPGDGGALGTDSVGPTQLVDTLTWAQVFVAAAAGVHSHGTNLLGGSLTWSTCLAVAGQGDHDHSDNTKGGTLAANTVGSSQLVNTLTWAQVFVAGTSNPAHTHQDANNGGTLDHGAALTGLGGDDHTQYSLVNAGRNFTANIACDIAAPTAAAHLARKDYVDNATAGIGAPARTFDGPLSPATYLVGSYDQPNDLGVGDQVDVSLQWLEPDASGALTYVNLFYLGTNHAGVTYMVDIQSTAYNDSSNDGHVVRRGWIGDDGSGGWDFTNSVTGAGSTGAVGPHTISVEGEFVACGNYICMRHSFDGAGAYCGIMARIIRIK